MENTVFAQEAAYLEQTIALASRLLQEKTMALRRREGIMRDMQSRRTAEERHGDMGGLYSSQGFMDLVDASQEIALINNNEAVVAIEEKDLRALAYAREHPYFARIDFFFDDEAELVPIYIGRHSLMEEGAIELRVYDWRSPIAGVFYRYGLGAAQYETSAGVIKGAVRLKRQYEIAHRSLVYYFDADVNIQDVFLREMLSKSSSATMKAIVETIQREQDEIIREMTTGLLMVQGTAGSGKTAVALHRVAYLMYEGLKTKRLRAEDILILAPNTTFEHYICTVLPELGEEAARTQLFEDLLSTVLPAMPMESRIAWTERELQCGEASRKRLRGIRGAKGTQEFANALDCFVDELVARWIPFCDVFFCDELIMCAQEARAFVRDLDKPVTLHVKLHALEKEIWRRIRERRPTYMAKYRAQAMQDSSRVHEIQAYARMLAIEECKRTHEVLRSFVSVDVRAYYLRLFSDEEAFLRLFGNVFSGSLAKEIRRETLQVLQKTLCAYDDAVALAYLQLCVYGCKDFAHMRHILVDEAQDYDAMHARVMAKLFPRASYTFLGDAQQVLCGEANTSLYALLPSILNKTRPKQITLQKSFRCTREIWAFASQYLPEGAAGECFARTGEDVCVYREENSEKMHEALLKCLRECKALGHKTIALLCKTRVQAQRLHARMQDVQGITLLSEGGVLKDEGVTVLPLSLAKGLEFDAVLVCNAESYPSTQNAQMYIACTRALHKLCVFYGRGLQKTAPKKGVSCI